jgi:hypothetical protein
MKVKGFEQGNVLNIVFQGEEDSWLLTGRIIQKRKIESFDSYTFLEYDFGKPHSFIVNQDILFIGLEKTKVVVRGIWGGRWKREWR